MSSSYMVLYFNAIFMSDGSVPFVVYAKEILYLHSPGYTANSVSMSTAFGISFPSL